MAISGLTEGMSVRSIERVTGVHRDTILRLQGRVGAACAEMMDRKMVDLPCKRVEVDEQWTFVLKKQSRMKRRESARRMGDFWIWVGIDSDLKVVPSFRLGKRTAKDANAYMKDLAKRLRNRVQLSTDGLVLYVDAVERAFGGAVDYAQIVKVYEAQPLKPNRRSPPRVSASEKKRISGAPDPSLVSTSIIERLNLTTRMRCRRLTRLVDSFSRKPENLKAALDLHFACYNFVKRHESLGGATPAMAAGVANSLWSIGDLVDLAN